MRKMDIINIQYIKKCIVCSNEDFILQLISCRLSPCRILIARNLYIHIYFQIFNAKELSRTQINARANTKRTGSLARVSTKISRLAQISAGCCLRWWYYTLDDGNECIFKRASLERVYRSHSGEYTGAIRCREEKLLRERSPYSPEVHMEAWRWTGRASYFYRMHVRRSINKL